MTNVILRSRSVVILMGLFLAACDGDDGPTIPGTRTVSVIDVGISLQNGFQIADTVRAGELRVDFFTFGSSSCTKAAGEDIDVGAATTTIRPYDEGLKRNAMCTADLGQFRRTVLITLTAGTRLLRLEGRRGDGTIGVLERSIVVLP